MVFSEETGIQIRNRIIFSNLRNFFEKIYHIPYVLVKGEALSIQAYGKEGKRNYSDIDILINTKDIGEVEKILVEEGFTSHIQEVSIEERKRRVLHMLYSHQIVPYFKKVHGIMIEIDINFDIYWGGFEGKKKEIEILLNRAIDCEIYDCKVKILPPLEAAMQLVLHNYKDLNSVFHLINKGGMKAYLYWDVYYLLKRNYITANELYQICSEWDVVPYAFYLLYYIKELSKDSDVDTYLNIFTSQEGQELLNCYGLDKKTRKVWGIGFEERLENKELANYLLENMSEEERETLKKEYRYY